MTNQFSLIIRKAKKSDKKPILSFLNKTFRWGDYIGQVWDRWLKQKTLLTVEENKIPIGMGNAFFSKNQVWIEGLRIHPKFRRQGYASALVNKIEEMAKKRGCKISRMLVADSNTKSLKMARSLGYKIEQKWWLYNLQPKKHPVQIQAQENPTQLTKLTKYKVYSESWRWFNLDISSLNKLRRKNQLITISKNGKITGMGIWNISEIDRNVLQLGYISGSPDAIKTILKFIQNKGYELKSKRIQILAPSQLKLHAKGLEKIMLFCLLRKNL